MIPGGKFLDTSVNHIYRKRYSETNFWVTMIYRDYGKAGMTYSNPQNLQVGGKRSNSPRDHSQRSGNILNCMETWFWKHKTNQVKVMKYKFKIWLKKAVIESHLTCVKVPQMAWYTFIITLSNTFSS